MISDVYLKDIRGLNCLHVAAIEGHLNLCKTLLTNYKFDVNIADNGGRTALHSSAQSGNCDLFKYIAGMVGDVYLKDIRGLNCLHVAASKGHLNLCKTLVTKYKFNVNMENHNGRTALHSSAQSGNYDLFKYFAGLISDVYLKDIRGLSCLHVAAMEGHLNLCKTLVTKYKFDANIKNHDGRTALHSSAQSGNYDLFKYIAGKISDVYLKDIRGLNCLHVAAIEGHLNLCKTLLTKYKFDVNIADNGERTALHFSAQSGNYDLFKYIAGMISDVYLEDIGGLNCLHVAAMEGHSNLCKTLVTKYKFDVNITNHNGRTALHSSAQSGNYHLFKYFAGVISDVYLKDIRGLNCLHVAAIEGHLNLCKTLVTKHEFDVNIANNDGGTALLSSAQSGNYDLFEYIAGMVSDAYVKDMRGLNCLHVAAIKGHLNLCKTLVTKYKFDVNIANHNGRTALHSSAQSGNFDLFKYIAGIISDVYLKDIRGLNCLHVAAIEGHLNLCRTLVTKYKFDVNITNHNGRTALHASAQSGNYDLFKYFAGLISDVYLKDIRGLNCLHVAAMEGHLNLCKTLVTKYKFDVNVENNDGGTSLHCSAQSGNYDLFKYLADMINDVYLKDIRELNCLHVAAIEGHLNLCKTLVTKLKFDVNIADNGGRTALHFSAQSGNYDLFKYFAGTITDLYLKDIRGLNCLHVAAMEGHSNFCKTLVTKHKFDVNIANHNGRTALHSSAQSGNYDLFKYFAGLISDIYLKDIRGLNCLHVAAIEGHLNLCKTLVTKHKFDVNVANNDGGTALHSSAQSGNYDLFKYFAGLISDVYLKDIRGLNCLHVAAMKGHLNLCKTFVTKYKFDVNIPNHNGRTALHSSAQSGNYNLFKYIGDMISDVYLKDIRGLSCLHVAAMEGHLNLCKTLVTKYKFHVNIANHNGRTALHSSAQSGNYDLFKYFAGLMSDVYLKDIRGLNCLHVAAIEGHLNLCKKLVTKHKFDVNVANNDGGTSLHSSAQSGNCDLFKYIASMISDVYLKDIRGLNCLHVAAIKGHLNLCKTLVTKYKFDVNIANHNGRTALHSSAQSGNYDLFKYIGNMISDAYLRDIRGLSCLHVAAMEGHLNLCKALVTKYKFDVNIANHNGRTALHSSAQSGNYDLFKYIGGMISDVYLKDIRGLNCLHVAAMEGNLNLSKTLVTEYKFDVNIADNGGWTALHSSAQSGNYDLFKYIASMISDVYLKDIRGLNCLHVAAIEGHLNLCKTLVTKYKFDVNIADNGGRTALHSSAQSGNYDLFKYIAGMISDVYVKDIKGLNCLHVAAMEGHLNLCKTLVTKYKFDVNIANHNGRTALHSSAQSGNYDLFKYFAGLISDVYLKDIRGLNCLHVATMEGHLNLCKTLVTKYKFDVNIADNGGRTALHSSAQSGNYDLFEYIAGMISDVYLKDIRGLNCLHMAAMEGHLNLCMTLITKHKFDVNIADNGGRTALHSSAQSGNYNLFKYLAGLISDIYLKDIRGLNCLHMAAIKGHLNLCKTLVTKHKFDVNIADNDGWTALHCSARSGNYELVAYFTDTVTDIYVETAEGMNCLHIASRYGHLKICKRFLVEYCFDVNLTDKNGCTALHYSAKSGNFNLFLYVLEKGTDMYFKTNRMENVLHFSASGGHYEICEFVLKNFTKDYKYAFSKNQYTLNGKLYRNEVFYKYDAIFLHAMDIDGNTYLHLAAKGNHAKICDLLLKYDEEIVTLLNKKDETARQIAKSNGFCDVLNALKGVYEKGGMFFFRC